MTTMLAYHGDPDLKDRVVAEAVSHRIADQYRKGFYWRDAEQKGCSVGCMLRSSVHALSETKWGIPLALTHLQDNIFEGLPLEQSYTWTEHYFDAIPVGADLSLVSWQLTHWNLTDNLVLVDSGDADAQAAIVKCRSAIKQCADVIAPLTKGDSADADTAAVAVRAAAVAVRATVRATVRAAAVAVRAAADAAAVAVRATVRATVRAAAVAVRAAADATVAAYAASVEALATATARAAAEQCYVRMADKLIELLGAASIVAIAR